ncbi:Tad domain-containing protein [Frigidibacter sp. MR17.14]|uniref:TadE/TadG family type IV pilus assembly protein n=1 Tax=Frigidibacter sp. MR17.14 TaxID=3126509 RepID=UPI003012D6FF
MPPVAPRFRTDETGAVLVLWGLAFGVFLGLVALTFDLGRLSITQTELQSYADSVALAAAGELDGGDGAIARATAAAAAAIADSQTFGTGAQALSSADYTLHFRQTLSATTDTTDDSRAAYVRVVIATRSVGLPFAAAFAAVTGQDAPGNTTNAVAVAGMTQYACEVVALMFCLPSAAYKADDNIGHMIKLRDAKGTGAWGPGDFGFVDPPAIGQTSGPCVGLKGGPYNRCMIGAIGAVPQCYALPGVDMQPGQKVGSEEAAFNTRFDLYLSSMSQNKTDPAYAPAPNVIKGVIPQGKGQTCVGTNSQVSNTKKLPRDDCSGSSCDRFGDGVWTTGRAAYVAANYGATDPHSGARTRFEYYMAEIAAHGGGASKTAILSGVGLDGKDRAETGRPQCSSYQSSDPRRRVVIAAGIDCTANPVQGAASKVPVHEYVQIFLTEPVVSDSSNFEIWGEVVGSAGGAGGAGGDAGIFHDVVQLYR